MEKKWTQLWLSYTKKADKGNSDFVKKVQLSGFDAEHIIVKNALAELKMGTEGMLCISPAAAIEGELTEGIKVLKEESMKSESYQLCVQDKVLLLKAADENGMLYGIFHILRTIAMEESLADLTAVCVPDNPLRMYNHWDNMDGSIERGYSGESFFFAL